MGEAVLSKEDGFPFLKNVFSFLRVTLRISSTTNGHKCDLALE